MRSIEVDHVSKCYRLGGHYYVTLRDTLGSALRRNGSPARRDFWALRTLPSPSTRARSAASSAGVAGKIDALEDPGPNHGPHTRSRPDAWTSRGAARGRNRLPSGAERGRENVFLNGAILEDSRSDIRRRFDDIVATGVGAFSRRR